MTQQTINTNSTQPLGLPNTGTGTDQGDTWDVAAGKINSNFNDLYGTGRPAGGGTATFGAAGMIARVIGPVGSGNTNTSQTLASYTLPANTLQSVGQEIEVTAWGVTANNAASKSIILNIGGASLSTGSQTGAAYTWNLVGKYIKQSSDAQNYYFSGAGSSSGGTGGGIAPKAGTDTSVDTGTIAITCVATDASAATGDITLLGFTVEFFS
jgi:hypothetical protein